LVDLLALINLPFLQSLAKFFRWKVNELYFIGRFKERIRDRFLNKDARYLGHHISQAGYMLDVNRSEHVDPDLKQFVDILPALGVSAAVGVGMSEFIYQDQSWSSGEAGVNVQLFELDPPMLDHLGRHLLDANRK